MKAEFSTRAVGRVIVYFLVATWLFQFQTAAQAQTNSPLYWNKPGATSDWGTATNWVTTAGGSTSPASPPGSSNDAIFNSSTIGNETVTLAAPQAAMGLYFVQTGTTTIHSSSTTSETLTIGADGITCSANAAFGAPDVTLGDSNDLMPISLAASQAWVNNMTNANTLTVLNGVSLASSVTTASTLTLAGTSTGTNLLSGIIANGGSGGATLGLTVSSGVWSLANADTYSGATTVNGGTLSLASTGSVSSSSPLALGGGTLQVVARSTSLAFNGTTVNTGFSIILADVSLGGSGANTIALGALTPTAGSGGMVKVVLPTFGHMTTTTTNNNGIIGGWAVAVTSAGASTWDWATSGVSGTSNITALASSAYDTSSIADGSTINFKGGTTGSGLTANTTINSLNASSNVLLNGHMLTVNSGGIIYSGDVFIQGNSSTNSILTSGLASGELFIYNPSTGQSHPTIGGVIKDNGSTPVILAKGGPGPLSLVSTNAYTGGTVVNQGTLELFTASQIAAGGTGAGTLGATTGPLTVNSGGTLDLNGLSQTVGNLSGSGTITNSGGGSFFGGTGSTSVTLTIGNGNGTGGSFAGVIQNGAGSGTLALTKTGSGAITLSGVNTYTGATNINGGSLRLTTSPTPLSTSTAITVSNSSSTFAPNPANGGSMNGGASLVLNSGTVLNMAGDTAAGTFNVKTSSTSTAGALTLAGATLDFDLGANGGTTVTDKLLAGALTLSGTNNINITGFGAAPLTFGTYPLITVASGIVAADFHLNTTSVVVNGVTYNLSLSATGATLENLVVASSVPAVTWTGRNGGNGVTNSSWDTGGVSTNWANGATAAAYQDGGPVTFNDTNAANGNAPISNSTVAIQAAGVAPASVTFNNNSVTYSIGNASGATGITGATNVTIQGGGTVAFTSPNTYTGGTSLTNGNVVLSASTTGSPGAVTSGPLGTGTVAISTSTASPTLETSGAFTFANAITISGNVGVATIGSTADANSTFSGNITLNNNPGFFIVSAANAANGHILTISGNILQGTGIGSGFAVGTYGGQYTSQTLFTGASTFSNGLGIVSGTVLLGSSSSGSIDSGPLGTGTAALGTPNGGSAASLLFYTTPGLTVANPITVLGGSVGLLTLGGENTSGTNTFGGSVTLNPSVNGGIPGVTVTEAAGSGTLAFTGSITSGGSGTVPIIFAPGSGAAITTAGTAVIGGGAGTISITQNGAGTTTLAGANTYTGTTTISSGTLRVANTFGSATGANTVTVGAGGTLAGSTSASQGTIAGQVTVNGSGTLAAFSGATLTLNGGLILQTGSLSSFTLGAPNGTSNPLVATSITAGNSLTVSGAHTINLAGAPVVGTYDLFSYTGGVTGFGSLTLGTQPGSLTYALMNNTAGNQVDLIVTQPAITWTGHTGGNGGTNDNWTTSAGDTNWADATNAPVAYQDAKAAVFGDTNVTGGPAPDGTVNVQSAGVAPAVVTFTNSAGAGNVNVYTINTVANGVTPSQTGIYGTARIVMSVTGTVVLPGPNSFTGTVTINSGKLNVQNNAALGASSGVTIASGAALELQGGIAIGSIPLGLSGTGLAANPAGALNSVSGANSYAGAISLGSGGATISSSNAGDTLTLSGGINNGGPPVGGLTVTGPGNVAIGTAVITGGGGLTYNGTGTLTLSFANTYSGPTTISSGTLRVTNSSGSATGSNSVGVSGATLTGTGLIGGAVTLSNAAVLVAPASGTLNIGGGLTLAAGGSSSTFTLGAPNGASIAFVTTSVSGGGNSLIASGAHTVNLTGTPQLGTYDLFSYTGGVTNFGNMSLGTNPGGFTYQLVNNTAGNQIDLTVTAPPLTWTGQTGGTGAANSSWDTVSTNWASGSNPIAYQDGSAVTFGDANAANGGATITNSSVTIQAGGVTPALVTFTNTGAAAGGVDYIVSNSGNDPNGIKGPTGIIVQGTGSVTLLSPNTFTGAVQIQAGKINVRNSSSLGTSSGVTVSAGAALELQSGIGIGAIPLSLTGTGVATNTGALDSVSGNNAYAGNITIGSGGGMIASSNAGDTLTLSGTIANGGNLLSVTGPGNVTISNSISGAGGLSKSGSGTLLLSQASGNTYGGATGISGGLLLVTNAVSTSATGPNAVSVSTGGTLGGSGFIGGPVSTVSSGSNPGLNGHISPSAGGTASTLTINNTLALDVNSFLDFQLNTANAAPGSGGNDLVNVTGTSGSNGTLTLSNDLTLNVTPGLNFAAGTYHLITYTGSLFDNSGSFSGWTATGVGSHPYHFAVGSGELDLVVLAGNGSAQWNVNGNGNFSQTPNWSPPQLPSGAGLTATFGNGATVTVNNNVQVLVDGAFTDGTLAFTNTNGAQYTLTSDGNNSHGITLTSGNSSGAAVNVTAGTHSIFANLTLADSGGTTFNIAGGAQLTMGDSSIIGESGGSQGLTKAGDGTLVMLGTNSYTGPTMLNGGTTVISSDKSLGAAGLITINAATLDSEAFSLVSSRNYAVGNAASTINVEAFRTLEITTPVTGTGSLTVTGGNSSSTLILDKANSYAGNTNVNSGYLRLDATSGTATIGASATVTVAAGATLELAGTVSALSSGTTRANVVNNSSANTGGMLLVTGSNQQVGTIDGTGDVQINDGADLTASRIRQNSLTIGESSGPASLVIRQSGPGGGNPVNDTAFSGNLNSLTIANNGAALGTRTYRGTLNINNNGLVIPYGTGPNPLNDINDMVRSGYNNGAFTGQGITSTTAASTPGLNIAVADNAQLGTPYTTFEGQTVSIHSVLVRMTYMDDLTLAGTVSQNDAILFGANYDNGASSNHYWWQGDLNHDGHIDQNDAILFGANYNTALPPLDGSGGGLLQFNAALDSNSLGANLSAVPEPSTVVLLALGGLALAAMLRKKGDSHQI